MKTGLLLFSLVLLLLGAGVFITNHENSTISVTSKMEDLVLLNFSAPIEDPFDHILILSVDTSKVVEITSTMEGENRIIFTDEGRGKFTIGSGDTIKIVLSNPKGATGTVGTSFFHDSWNYTAYTMAGLGIIFFLVWFFRSDDDIKEL